MNGRDKRQQRRERRATAPTSKGIRDPFHGLCPNGCGEPGPHFVPPSFGDPGFYICTPTASEDVTP